ncbi:MAG: hypothetical protein GX577_15260 [Leptolinea sp.]|nr:hypothetical protein [Leptolinea sp.]
MDALFNKVEILFWDRITPALSDSKVFQVLVKKGYDVIHQPDIESYLLWGIGSAVVGLLTGLILSVLSAAS